MWSFPSCVRPARASPCQSGETVSESASFNLAPHYTLICNSLLVCHAYKSSVSTLNCHHLKTGVTSSVGLYHLVPFTDWNNHNILVETALKGQHQKGASQRGVYPHKALLTASSCKVRSRATCCCGCTIQIFLRKQKNSPPSSWPTKICGAQSLFVLTGIPVTKGNHCDHLKLIQLNYIFKQNH